jgi:hypothetical protein
MVRIAIRGNSGANLFIIYPKWERYQARMSTPGKNSYINITTLYVLQAFIHRELRRGYIILHVNGLVA